MKYRTSEQELPTSLSLTPTALPYRLSYPKYPAPTSGTLSVPLHTTASLTIIQCVQQINWRYIPCMGPCAGINRKMCQPWSITRKMQQKRTGFPPANLSTLPTICDQGMWSALHHSWVSFEPLQSTVVTAFTTCLYIQQHRILNDEDVFVLCVQFSDYRTQRFHQQRILCLIFRAS
jgi:hypothetical protein